MTLNPTLGESNDYKPAYTAPPANLLLPEEYKDILSHLIGTKIIEQKIILTEYGLPPRQRLENEEYLVFTNENMTDEILENSEALDLAVHHFVSSMDVERKLIKNQKEKNKYLCLLISMLVTICLISDIQTNR